MLTISEIMLRARSMEVAIPAFNVPYLPMTEPVVQAVLDQKAFALIETARPEWIRFESYGPAAVAAEFARWGKPEAVRLHLDHVPVIDEDFHQVDYLPIIQEALNCGYELVMIDGSRLALDENIGATRQVVELAHAVHVPVEAELGAVLGHEAGPLPSYEELFVSKQGFTAIDQAARMVIESGCDWLSVAIGNIHGAIASGRRDEKKVAARLDLERLEQLWQATRVPLVLHGGSGIQQTDVQGAMKHGITKVNVGTEIRQPYEVALRDTGSVVKAQQAVYDRTVFLLHDYFCIAGLQEKLTSPAA